MGYDVRNASTVGTQRGLFKSCAAHQLLAAVKDVAHADTKDLYILHSLHTYHHYSMYIMDMSQAFPRRSMHHFGSDNSL